MTIMDMRDLTSDALALPRGFFAYPSTPPSLPPTIKAAVEAINKTQTVRITPWVDLDVGGKYIMPEICNAIDASDLFCGDVTTVNANVMFELGFAIARNKRVWLVRDESYTDPKKEFEQLRILTTIGYAQYTNSEQIIRAFFRAQPHTSTEDTIFKQSIEPMLGGELPSTLLYLKSRHDTEASVLVTRALEESKLALTVDDPRESGVQPLYWYAQRVYSALGTLAHLLNPAREGFRLHNARYALVSGMAYGMDVPLWTSLF